MIAARLMGGLGNQMFQYAAARSLADRLGTDLVLDISRYGRQPRGETPRQFELHTFAIRAEVSTRPIRPTYLPVPRKFGGKGFRRLAEHRGEFNPAVLTAGDGTLLDGYWQSERYFEGNAHSIRLDLTLAEPLSAGAKLLAESIDKQTVCMHVRRGDYVSNPAAATFHGVLPLDYYRKAASLVAQRLSEPRFLVVSDDADWCRNNLSIDYPLTVVESRPEAAGEDMELMRRCRHLVIANSSFSWWGAWLSRDRQTVVAPRVWFQDPQWQTRDLIPADWIRL